MAADTVQHLDPKDLDAVLARAEAERWTELALLAGDFVSGYASRLRTAGWRPTRIFILAEPLQDVPEALSRLIGLTALDLGGNQIGDAGAEALAHLTGLTSLDLQANRIGDAGAEALARLTGLTSLALWGNRIGDAGTEALARLTGLTSLNLGANQIGDAGADALARLSALTSLQLRNNGIGDAGAAALARLSGLTSLDLGSNLIGAAGAGALAQLSSLTALDLSVNQIGDAGAEALARLTGLTALQLWGNRIGDAGAEALARLTYLSSLDLGANRIGATGAEALARLTSLTSIDLRGNQIGDAGAEALARRAGLTALYLWGNQIGDAGAAALARHTGLTALYLGANQIGDAGAAALARLTSLTALELWNNLIGDAGARAVLNAWADPATSERRRHLDLGQNSDLGGFLPAEVLKQTDAQALIAYWRRFREAEAKGELRPLNEAKVLVLGNEAVGKTSLVRFLAEGLPRVEGEPKTAGIVIKPDVEIEDWSTNRSAIRLHFWDFGGQEIMHQTHRYFLTRRSLYLVVLEDRREDDLSVYDWLKVIRSRGGESPVLVVINKCDAGAPNRRLDETGIQAAYPNVVGFVAVSCNEGDEERMAGLRQRIAGIVVADLRLKHVRDPFPPEQLRVKQEVAAAAAAAQYLERAAFVRLCEDAPEPGQRITDPALQRALLQLLHDLGTVVAHGLERERGDGAREVTLLDPNWLTEAIYRLLNSKRILDKGGVFVPGDMARELDPARYPAERHGYIVDMMQEPEIGLCFRLPGQGEPRWLIPECLPSNEPEVARFFEGAMRFRYTYELLPSGLLPRFIVEAYNKVTERPTRWRAGAILEVDGCTVLVRGDRDRRRVDLAVTGPEGRRRSALAAVRHDFDVVHKLNPEIGTEARVPLPDDPEVDVGYDDLAKWEAAEGPDYTFWPEKAARKYTVRELLDGVRERAGRWVPPDPDDPVPDPPAAGGLAGRWWFPVASGAAAMVLAVVLYLLPTNEWRVLVGVVVGVGVGVMLLATHFAPGRFYRRLLSWAISAGFLIHAAGFSADAGFWGEAAARLQWDGRVGIGFSIAWAIIVVALILADLQQQKATTQK